MESNFTVIDIGTTGLEPESEITYLAAVRFVNCESTEKYLAYVKCKTHIPDSIAELIGITNEFLDINGVEPKDALYGFIKFCGNDRIVTNKVEFIKSFIDRDCQNNGFETIQNEFIDVKTLFRVKTGNRMSRVNAYLYLGLPCEENNTSPIDFDYIELCGNIYIKLQQSE